MSRIWNKALALCMASMSAVPLLAQSSWTVNRGEEVQLKAADGYASYQWQVSSDAKHFVDLPQGNVQQLQHKIYGTSFFRVKVTDAQNKVSYRDTTSVVLTPVKYDPNFTVLGGGHGYVETLDGRYDGKGIDIPVDKVDGVVGTSKKLTKWVDGQSRAVYYIHHPQDIVDTEMYLTVKSGAAVSFKIQVFDPDLADQPLAENIVALRGTGKEQQVSLVALDLPRSAYFRYQLDCLKGWENIVEISKFHHYSPSILSSYKANALGAPSVHLNNWRSSDPDAPKGQAYDWCYQEVMMPKSSDVRGTYIESIGAMKGYMGIQMQGYDADSISLHGVIFSMWDDGSTDDDPNLPDFCRATAVDYGDNITIGRFGNEGTGVKSYMHGHQWECDTYVQFLTNCRPDTTRYTVVEHGREVTKTQYNTIVSTWFNARDGKGWQYMATLRAPNRKQYFSSWYSFLENYHSTSGQAVRKGYYRNSYARSMAGKWYHFNTVGFGHTDGKYEVGARHDYSQGAYWAEDGTFFMENGGYLKSHSTEKTIPLNTVHTAVDTIQLEVLQQRVEEAIAREQEKIEEEQNFGQNKLDKKGWKIVDFSSEETQGEKENGRARLIIDGNTNTYWHSKWMNGGSSCPHYLVVDMQELYEISGMEITMSGGTTRYIKSFNIYLSHDGQEWTKAYHEEDTPNEAAFRFLFDRKMVGRYLKLEITDSRDPKKDNVRVNEIEVVGTPVPTGIEGLENGGMDWKVACGDQELSITFQPSATAVDITLCRVDGAVVHQHRGVNIRTGQVVNLPMTNMPKGMYIVKCQMGGKTSSKSVLWK